MDKIKIGIVCYPGIGGSGIIATQLGQALCQLRYEVHFLSHDYPQR
jgi:glucose-6-phosphate isomerase